jgi:O-Antigen ligase
MQRLRSRTPSPALVRARAEALPQSVAAVRRRIGWIWGLLFLNVLPYASKSSLVPVPTSIGKVLVQGALPLALVLALSINRKALVRPNLFLMLMTILCATTTMMSIRGYFSWGSDFRAARLIVMVVVLWLLTPWWGSRDLLLLRCHHRALCVVLAIVAVGAVLTPGAAFSQAGGGRLGGSVWPIPPTQVAHYAAVLAGITIVLWFAGVVAPRTAAVVAGLAVVMLFLTHTRTALVGFLVALLVAGLSLFFSRQRVRKAFAVTVVIAALMALSFAPFLSSWFDRGQSGGQITALTGRTATWSAELAAPRTEVNRFFGYGMSNDSFNGLSIDSSWLSTYLDQGLVGDVIDGSVLLLLLLVACFSPRGPRRAVALFLVVYCLIASFTESGLGEASPYLLDLTVAMSILMTPATLAPEAESPAALRPQL